MRLYDLFYEEYPLITVDEYKMFQHTPNAIYHINTEAINEENVSALLEIIYSRTYSPEDVVYLFEYLFKADVNVNCIDDPSTVKSIIESFEFKRFSTDRLSCEQRSRIYETFSDQYNISDSEDAISFTKCFGCFVPEVEEIISSDNSACKEYCELIAEMNELSEIALLWLKNNYFTVAASEGICKILFEKGWHTDYIVATMLREKRMVMDDRIDFLTYFDAYTNVVEVFEIMSGHWDFLNKLQQQGDFSKLTEEQIIPMFKVPQTERFFTYMFSDNTTLQFKKLYLKEFRKFKEEKDSIAFQRLICKPENIKLVDSVELKESIYQRLWDSNRTHKGLFTRFWNKEWAKKLSQAQPV
jgi:hypothetical protein